MIRNPIPEEKEYFDELEAMPKKVLMFLGLFVLSCIAIGSVYWLIGFWKMLISSIILGSVIYAIYIIRKGILTARENNKRKLHGKSNNI